MTAERQIGLALRKERLLVRAGRQRELLATAGERLKKPCALADKIISAGSYAKAHPWTLGVAVGVTALIGRRHLFRAAGYAWSAWRAWRFIDAWIQESGLKKRFKNN